MTSPSDTAFSVASFITFILVCIPFPWHLEAWNTGTCLYMFWVALGLLSQSINSMIWGNNVLDIAPVWCDITSKIIIGLNVAIPAASLCINHRLYCIAAVRSVTSSKAEKRRTVIIDLAIGLGIPLVVMALHYVVQGHRYNIYEGVGCFPYTYNTLPAYFLVFMVPIPIGLISGVYCILSITAFRKRNVEFKQILSANSNNLNSSRFFRLMLLAGIEVACCIPVTIANIVYNATQGAVRPWISWEDTHYRFSRVDQIPAVIWRSIPAANTGIELTRWMVVVCGLIFFFFFGFADEAQKHYKIAFNSIAKRVGYSTTMGSTKVGTGITSSTGFNKFKSGCSNIASSQRAGMPIFIRQEVIEKRDSFDTLSDMTSVKESIYGSETGSNPSSPFNTLTKQNAQGLKPPASPSESTHTVVEFTERRPISFPASLKPSGSFLDLSTCKEGPGNDDNV